METFNIKISANEARILLSLLKTLPEIFYAYDERPSPALNNFVDNLSSLVVRIGK